MAVLLRTGEELAKVVDANPYPVSDPTKVVVAFLDEEVELGQLELGDLGPYLPDELTLHGREIYVSVPNGQGRSKLMEALVKRRLPTDADGAELAHCRGAGGDDGRRARLAAPAVRDRRPPVAAEGPWPELDAGGGLAPLVLGPVDEHEHALDDLGVELGVELLA